MDFRSIKAESTSRAVVALLFISVIFALTGCTSAPKRNPNAQETLQEQWGIDIVAVRTTAAGSMIDFRYRVLDADKAATLFKRANKPFLIHQKSGKVLEVPVTAKIGPLRSSDNPQAGRTYWMFFGNKTRLVQKGDTVTVVIGDFRAENITVQ